MKISLRPGEKGMQNGDGGVWIELFPREEKGEGQVGGLFISTWELALTGSGFHWSVGSRAGGEVQGLIEM